MFNAALFREPKAREDHPTLMFNAKRAILSIALTERDGSL
jgi:hypothetical protein